MGPRHTLMKARYLPLALSNYAAQVTRDPLAFASKVRTRLTGRPLRHAGVDHSPAHFRTPIHKSPKGSFNGRVLHVLTNSLPHSTGGYAIRSHEILRAQRAAGLDVSAITRLGYPINVGKFPQGAFELIDGLRYTRSLPPIYPLTFGAQVQAHAQRIAREAEERGASVLHTTTPWPNAAATSLAARQLGLPWIYEVRGEPEATWAAAQPPGSHPEQDDYFLAARAKEEEAMRAAAAVVALSETSASSLRDRGISVPIAIAPNAVEASWASKRIPAHTAQEALGLPHARYVGAVSSIVEYEGFDTLIRAVPYLPGDVAVLLVGSGTALPALRTLAEARGVAHRVVFAGRQPNAMIAPWYSALDVFVVPRRDALVTRTVTPMKTLQAHAFGTPIVASDLPALREVTQGAAYYATPDSPEQLAGAIRVALKQPVGNAPQLPTWADVAAVYADVYANLYGSL